MRKQGIEKELGRGNAMKSQQTGKYRRNDRVNRTHTFEKASYTVEASVVISLIMMIISAFLYEAMMLHDRAMLQDMAFGVLDSLEKRITTAVTSEGELDEERIMKNEFLTAGRTTEAVDAETVRTAFLEEADERTILAKAITAEIVITKSEVKLSYTYHFEILGSAVVRMLIGGEIEGSGEYERKIRIPARTIVRVGRSIVGKK